MDLTALSNFTFGLALALYLVAMAAYFHSLAFHRHAVGMAATTLASAGLASHLVSVVARGLAAGRVPWGNMYEYSSMVGLLAVAAYLVVERMWKARAVGGFALGAAVLVMGGAILLYVPPGPLVPALNSYWIRIHVVAAMTGSALFMLGTVFTVLYLFQDVRERRVARRAVRSERAPALAAVRAGGLPDDHVPAPDEPETLPAQDAGGEAEADPRRSRLPSAGSLDRLAYRTIAFAFPIWTFAVIAGAIWAEEAWGRYWGWDPKETWSFITWTVFAAYLHARATVGWRGRRAAVLALVGFGALAFNLYAVNLVVKGLHSYAGV
ncbi:MAG: c-type cytochrome biogenesis protein CcsB [Actinomycetota bacterium]